MRPLQPIKDGRFEPNKIVQHLLDHGGIDLNALAVLDFSQEDREQFAQLIGYSVSGFGSLSYVREETYSAAVEASAGVPELEARNAYLRETLDAVRKGLKEIVPQVFAIHPDDLHE